jgi:hypothetical protein
METTSGLLPPWRADGAASPAGGVLPVQLIMLVESPPGPGWAELRDTLAAARATPVARRLLVVGHPDGAAHADGFDVIRPRPGGFGERMAGAFADAYARAALPVLLIQADTPAVSAGMLTEAARALVSGEADAAVGLTLDGGCWLLGLGRPDRSLLAGVGDREAAAGRLLLGRLAGAGLRVALGPRLAGQATGPVTVTRVP